MAKIRKDVSAIRLYVEEHNETAKKIYEALGFRRTSYEIYELETGTD